MEYLSANLHGWSASISEALGYANFKMILIFPYPNPKLSVGVVICLKTRHLNSPSEKCATAGRSENLTRRLQTRLTFDVGGACSSSRAIYHARKLRRRGLREANKKPLYYQLCCEQGVSCKNAIFWRARDYSFMRRRQVTPWLWRASGLVFFI